MKKLYPVLVCIVLIVSCNKAGIEPEENSYDKDLQTLSGRSYERALEVASIAPGLFSTASTKSAGKRIEECVPVISSKKLSKSTSADTLMYIFNYAGNDGYVIVPNDERKGFVLAYADGGRFDVADTAVNEVAKNIMVSAVKYCEAPIADINAETKWSIDEIEYKKYAKYFSYQQGDGCAKLRPTGMYDFEKPGTAGYPESYYETAGCKAVLHVIYLAPGDVDPLLATKWGQGYPYNLKAPLFDGKNAVAGCVATAAAQVVAFHGFPEKYPAGTYIQGIYYGDTETKISVFRDYVGGGSPGPGIRDYISRLFRVIGDKIGNIWGANLTLASTWDVTSALKWLGYSNAPKTKNYDIAEIQQSLDAGYPVIVSGNDTSGSGGGHAYVIDGYKSMHRGYNYYYFDANGDYHKRTSTIYSTPDPPQRYVHINWGWDGTYNGFYLNSVFDTSDRDSWFESKANYNGGMSMITFIHP